MVELAVAEDGLHVFAGFGVGDGLDVFGDVLVVADGHPLANRNVSGVVGGKGVFNAGLQSDRAPGAG